MQIQLRRPETDDCVQVLVPFIINEGVSMKNDLLRCTDRVNRVVCVSPLLLESF